VAALRWNNLTAAGVDLWVEEESSADSEVWHRPEIVGWATFE
jgi:phosphoglycerate dehydrogenase-like enzyme